MKIKVIMGQDLCAQPNKAIACSNKTLKEDLGSHNMIDKMSLIELEVTHHINNKEKSQLELEWTLTDASTEMNQMLKLSDNVIKQHL